MIVRRSAAAVTALILGATIAGCSSDANPTAQHSTRATTATHWWSGSDYCDILRQTMRAGHSILAGAKADDGKFVTATRSFVADLTATAPGSVRSQWQVLGPALTDLVESDGKLSAISGVNSRLVSQAATAIAADAETRCHVDVSA